MKFMMALIYALAATLIMGLLAAFFYFSVLQQQTPDAEVSGSANLALLLFVNAVLVFSLILIWLENIPDTPSQSPLDKYISEVRENEKKDGYPAERLQPLLQKLEQISQSLSLTNKTLNLGLERLNNRIDDIENASIDKIVNMEKDDGKTEKHPELDKIFNDELAQTLSGLEIMQDANNKETTEEAFEDIDLDTLLNNKNNK
ncbi:MAG: hypothetical protein IJ532_02005 [Alphaproteobacteria bacterium]|nr:hypothetical protein [Alphaproteobacteria bacterium]